PYYLSGWRLRPLPFDPVGRWLGAIMVIAAIPPLIAFLVRFVNEGHGTPAPFAPPRRLVVGGPFRRVRNPGYISAVAIIFGQGLFFGSTSVLVYAVVFALVCHLFVVVYEEPTLRAKFGASYEAYCRQVPRWLPAR